MFYFVSAWYNQERGWYQEAPQWFSVLERIQFDDTVNHLKMFQTAKERVALLVLNYHPQLRYTLHQQDLLGVPYWSFFDDLQNCDLTYTKMIDFKELHWPKGTTFSYSPFMVIAHQAGQLLAHCYFGENGNLISVQYFEAGLSAKRLIFDDRGFLSSILYFEDNTPHHQDYLNTKGIWQIRELLVGDKQLLVNPAADRSFKQKSYSCWEELILERLTAFSDYYVQPDDCLVIASHLQHNHLLVTIFKGQRKVFSLFGERFDLSHKAELDILAKNATFIVTDNHLLEQQLTTALIDNHLPLPQLTRLSPFDTRLRLGRSQTIKELIICFFVDTLDQSSYLIILEKLLHIMADNPLIQLNLLTYRQDFPFDQIKSHILQMITANSYHKRFLKTQKDTGENQLDDDKKNTLDGIVMTTLTNDNQLISILDTARLVLDLGQEPDLYTQIASLSAGIPQINSVHTEYVTHGENGWVLNSFEELPQALKYYFDGLTNWNKSLVHTVQKMGDYTSGHLITQWKQLLEEEHG